MAKEKNPYESVRKQLWKMDDVVQTAIEALDVLRPDNWPPPVTKRQAKAAVKAFAKASMKLYSLAEELPTDVPLPDTEA